jgi:hypothetical protein
LVQITRIASPACGIRVAVARAAAFRVNDHLVPAPANGFADQAMIVALAVAGRCIEEIDAEIERAADRGDRLRVVGRSIDARHAVTAETNGRHHEIAVAELAVFHERASRANNQRAADPKSVSAIQSP